MSGEMYRRPDPTLAALLLNGGGNIGQPALPGDPQAQQQPQGLNDLLSQAFAPVDIGPPPRSKKPTVGARIAAAIGDAANAYARAYLPQMQPTNYQSEQRFRQQQGEDQMTSYQRAKALAGSEAGRDKARFLLSERDRNLIREDEQAARKQLKDEAIQQQRDALAQAKELAGQKIAADVAAAKAEMEWKSTQGSLDREKDLAVARIHASDAEGNAHAKFDVKELPTVMGNINQLAAAVPSYLAGDQAKGVAPVSESQIWDQVQMAIDASGLSPDGKAAATAHAKKWVGQAVRNFQQQQAAQAQQGTTVETPGILSKLGNVLTGKANLYNPGP